MGYSARKLAVSMVKKQRFDGTKGEEDYGIYELRSASANLVVKRALYPLSQCKKSSGDIRVFTYLSWTLLKRTAAIDYPSTKLIVSDENYGADA